MAPRRRPIRPVLEEILTGEVLTRIWTAVGCACDAARGGDELVPVVLNVWSGQLEARRRALNLLVSGRGLRVDEVLSINRLRRACERWTDALLGFLVGVCPVERFAFHRQRVHEFAQAVRHNSHGEWSCARLLGSFHAAFEQGLAPVAANPDLNRQIVEGILSCLEPMDATSLIHFRSVWLLQIEQQTSAAQAMIDDLVAPDEPDPVFRNGAPASTQCR